MGNGALCAPGRAPANLRACFVRGVTGQVCPYTHVYVAEHRVEVRAGWDGEEADAGSSLSPEQARTT